MSPARAPRPLGSLVVTVLLVASCRQIGSVQEHAACDGLESAIDGCTSCQKARCCDEALDCDADERCRDLDVCVAEASSVDEMTECGRARADALRGPYVALASCRARACPADCQAESLGFVYADALCGGCAQTSCGAEALACGASAECLGLAYCERACSAYDAACHGDCERAHFEGLDLARALAACTKEACATECHLAGPTADWSCIENPISPPASGQIATLTVYVKKLAELTWSNLPGETPFKPTEPVLDATVAFCTSPGQCQPPQPVNMIGSVGFDLTTGQTGFAEVESPTIPKTHAYVAPLTGDLQISVVGFTPEQFGLLFSPLGADPAKGQVTLRAVDCEFFAPKPDPYLHAAGVSFSLVPIGTAAPGGWKAYYGFTGDNPGTTTIAGNGNGGFINVPPGTWDVIATRRDSNECVAMQRIKVLPGVRSSVEPFVPGGCPKAN